LQLQPGQRTLQGTLEEVLAKVTGQTIRAEASGRTDAGVHALEQVVSFDTESVMPPEVLRRALNTELPRDMAVKLVEDAAPGFHARRDAERKRYRYVLCDGPVRDIFQRRYSWHVYRTLDISAMSRGAERLIGEHDFASFQSGGSVRETTVRTIFDLSIARQPPPNEHVVHLEVEANGFLYNMVRNIVGTLMDVGQGRRPDSWVAEVLAARNRRSAGQTAPPQGLFLVSVGY
jgi:tRNA pseudouridine38-40 synthase